MWDTDKQTAKILKKSAKAEAKARKKAAGTERAAGVSPPRGEPTQALVTDSAGAQSRPSPAERSAAAAERQVQLNRWRLMIALAALVIAVFSFVATQWWRPRAGDSHRPTASASESVER